MSVDLLNDAGEEMTFSNSGWRYLLEFAAAHGFRWPTDQDGDDADSLSDAQSGDLADAIERGVGVGSPDEIAARVSRELTEFLVIPSNSPNFRGDPIPMTARSIEYWNEFAAFARRSG